MQIDSEQINRSKYESALNVIKLVFSQAENQCKKYFAKPLGCGKENGGAEGEHNYEINEGRAPKLLFVKQ